MNKKSFFFGSTFELISRIILVVILSSITLGIYIPFGINIIVNYIVDNSAIEGRKLEYYGSGKEIIKKYLLWYFLSIISFGLYAFTIPSRLFKYIISNIHFIGECKESKFTGDLLGVRIVGQIIFNLLSLGMLSHFFLTNFAIYIIQNTIIDDNKLIIYEKNIKTYKKYKWKLFSRCLKNSLLVIITLGIYSIFLPVKCLRWMINRIVIVDETNESQKLVCEIYRFEMLKGNRVIPIISIILFGLTLFTLIMYILGCGTLMLGNGSYFRNEAIFWHYLVTGLSFFCMITSLYFTLWYLFTKSKRLKKVIIIISEVILLTILITYYFFLTQKIYYVTNYDFCHMGQYYVIDETEPNNTKLIIVKNKRTTNMSKLIFPKDTTLEVGNFEEGISFYKIFQKHYKDPKESKINNLSIIIQTDAFKDNNQVEDIVLYENVIEVQTGAFNNCDHLQYVYRFHVNTKVDPDAFINCENEVTIAPYFEKIWKDKKEFEKYV